MALQVYNTLTRRKEPFQPLNPPKVGMYRCGLTVYDYSHIGHARTAIAFESIRRWLKHLGYQVTYVENVTDVDDKIINRARERGEDPQALAAYWDKVCAQDMRNLGVSPPEVMPHVTEHMEDIVRLIQRLETNGFAYRAPDGSVYYRVPKKADYGKLSNRSYEEMMAGARVEPAEGKEDPRDFALWKASKPGEPMWDSPWGKGRPGWHIECSAMSIRYLGETFDIHGGGVDLVFPHHENEVAQSEGATGKPFVKVWLHTGFLTVNGEKMSKSLNNFVTIQDILKQYDPEVIRFFYANTHYRSGIDYSPKALDEAKRGLDRLRRVREVLAELAQRGGAKHLPGDPALIKAAEQLNADFTTAMNDDFNTREAVAALFNFTTSANAAIANGVSRDAAAEALQKFVTLARIITIFPESPAARAGEDGVLGRLVEVVLRLREDARKRKDFATSDRIRSELQAIGIEIQDKGETTTWRRSS